MAFQPFSKVKKVNDLMGEPILCWLQAPADTGKSTLMLDFYRTFVGDGIGILIPMDHRPAIFEQLAEEEGIPIFPVDPDTNTWNNEDSIIKALRTNLPGSGARVLVWDSVSPRFREIINEAQTMADMTPEQREKAGGNKNKISVYQPKSLFMEKVASIATYGLNTCWISHEFEGRDRNAKEMTKTTITETEIKKFRRNLNLWIRTGIDRGKYYVEIVWARDRQALTGKRFYDEVGMFKGMWMRLVEEFKGAVVTPWETVEYWANPQDAITAAMEQSVIGPNGEKILPFDHINHATNAYESFKRDKVLPMMTDEWKKANAGVNGAAARLLAPLWKEEVAKRLQNRLKIEQTIANGGKPPAEEAPAEEEEKEFAI